MDQSAMRFVVLLGREANVLVTKGWVYAAHIIQQQRRVMRQSFTDPATKITCVPAATQYQFVDANMARFASCEKPMQMLENAWRHFQTRRKAQPLPPRAPDFTASKRRLLHLHACSLWNVGKLPSVAARQRAIRDAVATTKGMFISTSAEFDLCVRDAQSHDHECCLPREQDRPVQYSLRLLALIEKYVTLFGYDITWCGCSACSHVSKPCQPPSMTERKATRVTTFVNAPPAKRQRVEYLESELKKEE